MAGGVDPFGLLNGAVVHPDDNIPLRIARRADGQSRAAFAQHDQRTGRVETYSPDIGGIDPGIAKRLAGRGADGGPDILAGLLDDIRALAPDRDIPLGHG